jgi:hypothetical protein
MKEAGKFPCTRISEKRKTSRVSENLKERNNSEDLGVDGTVMLKWIIKKWNRIVGNGMDSSGSKQGQVADSCKSGNGCFGKRKMRGNSCLSEELPAFQEGVSSTESVNTVHVRI